MCTIIDAAASRVEIWWNWVKIIINRKTKFL